MDMKALIAASLCVLSGCVTLNVYEQPPKLLLGTFTDDYDIRHTISVDQWSQQPDATYHIKLWNSVEQYVIAQNGEENPGDQGLWTRIDWVELEGMDPYRWAFCMSVFNAQSAAEASQAEVADRDHLQSGCNGFPFSRMQRSTPE